MLLPYHAMLKSKQTHARLGILIFQSLSRIERSSPITTIFESAQGFTHPVQIDKCSEAQFKSGVHLGCKIKRRDPLALLIISQHLKRTTS